MIDEITVVVPYYNESHIIETCLEQIGQQTYSAKRAIFVNSSSTDDSSAVLDNWIKNNQHRFSTKFENVFENTSNPGSSKNIGIQRANTAWVAFMDCGQHFEPTWLDQQINFANQYKLDVSFGVVYLTGINWVDRCACAQTYGYKRNRPCVPSTLVKKSIFEKTGLFLEGRRSGYDMAWRIKVAKLDIKSGVNEGVKIMYYGTNFASNFSQLFVKSILYARPALGIDGYTIPYYYISIFLLMSFALFIVPDAVIKLFYLYLLIRIFVTPIVKSGGVSFYKEHPFEAFLGLGIVGLSIDIGKVIGYFKGVKDFISNKQNFVRSK
jgi:glycosyltransferase involved in cell wall biosynthesis